MVLMEQLLNHNPRWIAKETPQDFTILGIGQSNNACNLEGFAFTPMPLMICSR